MEGEHGAHQIGGSNVEPNLVQNWPTQLDSSQTDLRIGSRTDPEPVSPHTRERLESVSVDLIIPRPWKHQSSNPLDQIMFDINTGVQTDLNSKTFVFFMLFYLTLSQRMFMKLLQILIGLLLCKRSCINLKITRFGILYHGLRKNQ